MICFIFLCLCNFYLYTDSAENDNVLFVDGRRFNTRFFNSIRDAHNRRVCVKKNKYSKMKNKFAQQQLVHGRVRKC